MPNLFHNYGTAQSDPSPFILTMMTEVEGELYENFASLIEISNGVSDCLPALIYVCMYLCIYECMCIYMYVSLSIYLYVFMSVCVDVYGDLGAS